MGCGGRGWLVTVARTGLVWDGNKLDPLDAKWRVEDRRLGELPLTNFFQGHLPVFLYMLTWHIIQTRQPQRQFPFQVVLHTIDNPASEFVRNRTI